MEKEFWRHRTRELTQSAVLSLQSTDLRGRARWTLPGDPVSIHHSPTAHHALHMVGVRESLRNVCWGSKSPSLSQLLSYLNLCQVIPVLFTLFTISTRKPFGDARRQPSAGAERQPWPVPSSWPRSAARKGGNLAAWREIVHGQEAKRSCRTPLTSWMWWTNHGWCKMDA